MLSIKTVIFVKKNRSVFAAEYSAFQSSWHPVTLSQTQFGTGWLLLLMTACIYLAALCLAQGQDWPDRPLQLPLRSTGQILLDGFIDAAVDESNDVTLPDMLGSRSSDFKPIDSHDINQGFVRKSGWMRFALQLPANAPGPQTLFLSLLPNFTDILHVYVAVRKPELQEKDFLRFEMGDHSPLLADSFNGLDNILPLSIGPGDTLVVYLCATNIDSTLNLSARIYSPAGYDLRSTIGTLLFGLWFGGMAILVVIQIVFFCFDRQPFYLFLAVNIFGTAITYVGGLGLSRLLLFPNGGAGNDYFIGIIYWLGLTAGALSITSFLNLRQRYAWIHRLFALAALLGLVGVVFVLCGHDQLFTPIAGSTILVITTAAMIVALRDYLHSKGADEALKLAAFILLWLGLILTNGQRYGILPLPNWVAQSYGLTSIVHFILLTGSLAVRLRKAETANRDADRRIVLVANRAERWANDLVVTRTQELAEAKKAAETALQAELDAKAQQVRFMEVISHQYRTPLAVIRSNLESVRFTLSDKDKPNQDRLERANRGIARLVEVLEINLARSRFQGPSFKISPVRQGLSTVVAASVSRARDLLHGADIRCEISPSAAHIEIVADADMLVIAIINLLENAVKFSSALPRQPVWLKADCQDGRIVIGIRDGGIGIPDGEFETVKASAVRGSNVADIEGTGLGLSLVARITAAHRGDFTLSAAPEGGTIVTIILPVANA